MDRRFFSFAVLSLFGGLAGGALSNLIVAGVSASASRSPRVIEAESIQVVDKLGKPRIILDVSDCDETLPNCTNAGMAVVMLIDQRGNGRLGLSSGSQTIGPNVILLDLDGKRRAQLSLDPSNGSPELSLLDRNLKRRAFLAEDHLDVGQQEEGGPFAGISVDKSASGVFLKNPGNSAVLLEAYSKESKIPAAASLDLFDGSDKVVAHLP